jgi:hypothetical protein
MKKIVFQTGGPFHPVEAQANLIQSWLPSNWKIKPAFGSEAFEQLTDADLYVAGGLHWTVLSDLSSLIGTDPEPANDSEQWRTSVNNNERRWLDWVLVVYILSGDRLR